MARKIEARKEVAVTVPAALGGRRNDAVELKYRAAFEADRPDMDNKATMKAYRDDLTRYQAWCVSEGTVDAPASPYQVAAYIKHLAATPVKVKVDGADSTRPRSPRSLDRVINAVQFLHTRSGVGRFDTGPARDVLNHYAHKLATTPGLAKVAAGTQAEAITADVLRLMLATCDRTTLRGKRDAAVLLLGFAVLGRASETSSLTFGQVALDTGGRGLVASVYRKKVKKWTHVPVPRATDPSICPVAAYEALLDHMTGRLGNALDDATKLFWAVDQADQLSAALGRPLKQRDGESDADYAKRVKAAPRREGISTDTVSNIVKRAAKLAGLPDDVRWSSHGLRRGGAQTMRANGAKLEQVEARGGWGHRSVQLGQYLDGATSFEDDFLTLDDAPRGHCATCTCHGPAVLDAEGDWDDVADAEVVD